MKKLSTKVLTLITILFLLYGSYEILTSNQKQKNVNSAWYLGNAAAAPPKPPSRDTMYVNLAYK